MKLLSKSQILTATNEAKETEIKEGLALARKIDSLRQTLGSVQKQYDDFVSGSKLELEKATKNLFDQKSHLENEIADLEIERKKLQEPLDSEWDKVNKEKILVESKVLELASKEIELEDIKHELSQKKQEIEKIESEILNKKSETERLLEIAKSERNQAELQLKETQDKDLRISKEIERKERIINKKMDEVENAKKMYERLSDNLKVERYKVKLLLTKLEYNERQHRSE